MKALIRCLQSSGHKVYCVTLRNKDLDWHEDFKELEEKYGVHTIFCDGKSKEDVTTLLGVQIDIWLDDNPWGIISGSKFTPEQLVQWREDQILSGGIQTAA